MRQRWALGLACGGLACGGLLAACVDMHAYVCRADAQCNAGAQGWCEDAGYCSYPDPECPSGRRYGQLAAGLSGVCTGGPGPREASSGDPSTSESSSTSHGSSSSSGGDDGTSEDTAPPQPVCGNGVVEGEEECDELDEVDGDGCNTDCVRSGSPRWSAVVASEAGNDRLFGLTQLVSGDVVAVGYIQAESRDVLITRFTIEGREVQRVVYDVDGGLDEAEAVAQGGTGRLYICGRATVAGETRAWVGRWEALLDGPPAYEQQLPATLGGPCYDVAYINSSNIVTVGGNGSTAWAYTFVDGNVAGGQEATVTPGGATNLKSVVRAPDSSVFVAGQASGAGVAYAPPSLVDLGLPRIQTAGVVELQTMRVTGDAIVVGGLLRELPTLDDLWVAAYELDGSERWVYAPARPAIDEIEDIALDPAGNVYAIGHVVSEAPDRWVGKLDPAGALVWERNDYANSEGDDRGRSIEVLPNGDLVVVAEIVGEGGDLDGWIARLAP